MPGQLPDPSGARMERPRRARGYDAGVHPAHSLSCDALDGLGQVQFSLLGLTCCRAGDRGLEC